MSETLRIFLPAYFIVYFGIAFVLKSVIVAKRIGKNPLVLPNDDTAYSLIGLYFKLTLIFIFLYVIAYSIISDKRQDFFLPILLLKNVFISSIGVLLLVFSLIWTIIAQSNMKNSWRIGIDTKTNTDLITTGLFSFSRNPIFFGMIVCLLGLFLVSPNAFTLLFLIIGYILIQIQIRLEEEFLIKQHKEKYLAYKQSVRRLI